MSVVKDYFRSSMKSEYTWLLGIISAAWVPRLINFAIKNKIFEIIANGESSISQIAKQLSMNEKTLFRILKGLEHIELLLVQENSVSLTSLGKLLLPETPGNLMNMALLWDEEFNNAWAKLPEAVKSGKTGFEEYYGEEIFDYFSHTPAAAKTFDLAMNSISQLLYPEVVNHLPLEGIQSIVDVGGGKGNLIKRIAEKNPSLHACLFELDRVIEKIKDQKSLPDTIKLIGGDFFENVPAADAHILSNIIHDWDDEQSIQILKNVRRAQPAHGKLFLLEMAVGHDQEPILARSTDLNMLVFTGGRERSYAEFKELLHRCGFNLEKLINVKEMTCLLIASPVI